MRISIVGGGNIGTQFAVHCAEKGHDVTVFTSKPEIYDGHLNIVDENGVTTHEGEPVLLEANLKYGELRFHQLNNGPVFGESTDDILNEVFAHKSK